MSRGTAIKAPEETGRTALAPAKTETFERYESNVRTYCRAFPRVFARGEGAYLFDAEGGRWLDFFSAAGSLNYGHNHPVLKQALIEYIQGNGVVNSLDLHTTAKEEFLKAFNEVILQPRQLNYLCQFCGPTGTNAVEAALKLARKATNRPTVATFSNSYHGMSGGSMAVSGSLGKLRGEPYYNADRVTFLPYDGFTGCEGELRFIRQWLTRKGSGIQPPAAFIVELAQCEGGVNVASVEWVRQVAELARDLGSLLIVDDIQTGCGRSAKFFAFEHYGITPDMVCLSKSISAFGSPMAILLMNPALDVWRPGEHTGTFRGFTYSFVTGARAIRHFWSDPAFTASLPALASQLKSGLGAMKEEFSGHVLEIRQLGLLAGVKLASAELTTSVQTNAFRRGLIVETVGPEKDTLKLLPPLIIGGADLAAGVKILSDSLREAVRGS